VKQLQPGSIGACLCLFSILVIDFLPSRVSIVPWRPILHQERNCLVRVSGVCWVRGRAYRVG
jgi:hypothetical protein